MKILPKEIVLRPRFQLELSHSKETILDTLSKTAKGPILVKRIDDHIFIKFSKQHSHFWSPQLQLEIMALDEKKCKMFGLFGPSPDLWTFFMFLHFGVATLFIVLGIWAYSSAALQRPYRLQIGLMVFSVILWFILYVFGRMGRRKGKPQMHQLYKFMMDGLSPEPVI